MSEKYLTISEFSERLGKSKKTVNSWIRKGLIKYHKTPGGHYMIPESELLRLLGKSDSPGNNPGNEVGGNPIEEADVRLHEDIRRARMDPKKPIIFKEIEDMAWWHGVIQELGKEVVFTILPLVQLNESEKRNYVEAVAKLSAVLKEMIETAKKDAELVLKIRELEEMNKLLVDENSKLKDLLKEWNEFYNEALTIIRRGLEVINSG